MSESLKRLIHLSTSVDGSQLRDGSLNGINYVICPVISKLGDNVEWPINAPTPEFIPADVLALSISNRNYRPITMGHPQDEYGNYISANDPDVIEKLSYGFTFAAKFEDGRVKQEMWIDPIRAAIVGPDAVGVITRLKSGQTVEVSEGDYVLSEIEEGEWNGKKYGAKWLACWSDHLATLKEGEIGACSIEDGCGALRASQGMRSQIAYIDVDMKASALSQARKPTYSGVETSTWTKPNFADYIKYLFNGEDPPTSISKCSSDLLCKIASHSLLGDPDAGNFQDLTFFSVVNPSTGHLNEKALRGVLAGKGSSGLSESALASAQDMATRLLNSEFSVNLPPKTPKAEVEVSTVDKKKESFFKRVIAAMSNTIKSSMSNNDLRWKLYKAIEKVDPAISFVNDEDLETMTVRYTTVIRLGDYWSDGEYEYHDWQRTFTVDENQNVTVNDDAKEVEYFAGYKAKGDATPVLEVNNAQTAAPCGCHKEGGLTNMSLNRASVINRLTASGGPFAGNKPALEAMNDAGLEAVDKAYPEKVSKEKEDKEKETSVAVADTAVSTSETVKTVSIPEDKYSDILAASNAFKAQQEARKSALVTSLSTAQTSFSAADLQAMGMDTLEKMGEAFKVNQSAISTSASYVGLPVTGSTTKPALRDLPDPLGLKAAGLRPDGQKIQATN